MAICSFARKEIKFLLNMEQYYGLMEVIGEHMNPDKYCVGGKEYGIYNIYYDTPDDFLIRESLSKPYYKEKIRDSVNSYLGFLRHISGYKLRRKICRAIAVSPLSEVFAVASDYTKITIVPKHSTDAYYRQQYHQLKIQLP